MSVLSDTHKVQLRPTPFQHHCPVSSAQVIANTIKIGCWRPVLEGQPIPEREKNKKAPKEKKREKKDKEEKKKEKKKEKRSKPLSSNFCFP